MNLDRIDMMNMIYDGWVVNVGLVNLQLQTFALDDLSWFGEFDFQKSQSNLFTVGRLT